MSVWERVVGQPEAVKQFAAAASAAQDSRPGPAMTHAWLVTGPPGSGRSTAAIAFASALVCPEGGCGQCAACHEVVAGTHPDVEIVRSTTLSLGKDQTKALVSRASGAPATATWRCFVLEDADRMTEAAANTLLKAIEEPTERTVWILCAPSPEDLLPTIRSRARLVALRVPAPDDVAALLVVEGADPPLAAFAAHASQGHIGRARALANDESVRSRRAMILKIPRSLKGVSEAYALAHDLKRIAEHDARERTSAQDDEEDAAILESFGQGATGVTPARVKRLASKALSDRAKAQQQRASRSVRDELDRHFVDLLGYYRDVLIRQLGVDQDLVNPDLRLVVEEQARAGDAPITMQRIDAIIAARSQLAGNVPPALVCESLMVQLLHPVRKTVRHWPIAATRRPSL